MKGNGQKVGNEEGCEVSCEGEHRRRAAPGAGRQGESEGGRWKILAHTSVIREGETEETWEGRE